VHEENCKGLWEALHWLGRKQYIYGPEGNQSVPARPSDKYELEEMESEEGNSAGSGLLEYAAKGSFWALGLKVFKFY